MPRPKGWRAVKSRWSYTVDDIARNQGVSKGTVRRWLKTGLSCLDDHRPALVLGFDLIAYLKARKLPKRKCALDEFYCFHCKDVREPAFDAIEYLSTPPVRYRLRALCCACSTVMHKAASAEALESLRNHSRISLSKATETLQQAVRAEQGTGEDSPIAFTLPAIAPAERLPRLSGHVPTRSPDCRRRSRLLISIHLQTKK